MLNIKISIKVHKLYVELKFLSKATERGGKQKRKVSKELEASLPIPLLLPLPWCATT